MRVQVDKRQLDGSLSLMQGVFSSRPAKPIEGYIHLWAGEGALTLLVTNADLDLRVTAPAEVTSAGAVLVLGQLFPGIVNNCPEGPLDLYTDGQLFRVEAPGAHFNLQTGPLADFPELEFIGPGDDAVVLDSKKLLTALENVEYAAGKNSYQATLRGIKFELAPGHLRTVASDGFRIALSEFEAEFAGKREFIVPVGAVRWLVKMLQAGDTEARVAAAEGVLRVRCGQADLNIRLLDGDFPDYWRSIPPEARFTIELEASDLRRTLERVDVMTDKSTHHGVEFVITKDRLQVLGESGLGRAVSELAVRSFGVEQPISLSLNAEFVIQAIRQVKGAVALGINSDTSPIVLSAATPNSYKAVMLPLRI